MKKYVLQKLRNIFLPKICPVCHKNFCSDNSYSICNTCFDILKLPDFKRCPKCGREQDTVLEICQECIKNSNRPWSQGLGVMPYKGPIGELIKRYKYNGDTALAPILAAITADGWKEHGCGVPDMIVPMPISNKRYRERGFNQCDLIAIFLEKMLNIPKKAILFTNRSTEHQAILDAKQRKTNVKNSFFIKNKSEISGKHILLFDDVLTTGNTLAEASKVLLKNNAAVSVLTIARG